MGRFEVAMKSINAVKEQTDSVILFCSLGKDSLVLLDMIYPHFKRIVCVSTFFLDQATSLAQNVTHIDIFL